MIGRRDTVRTIALALALALAVLVVYAPVRGHDFVDYDDDVYVTANPHVLHGLSWREIGWVFTHGWAANYHPLTWISHMLDVELFGLEPGPHHLVNVLFHGANAALCFLLLRSLTGRLWTPAFAAALFALHPLRVESVAWAAERKDVLCASFFLLTLLSYARYARSPSPGRYLLVCLGLLLALLAKPMAVSLPFVALLLDFWPLGRLHAARSQPPRIPSLTPGEPGASRAGAHPGKTHGESFGFRLVLEKLPLLLLVALAALATVLAQRQAGAASSALAVPLGLRALNALASCGTYLAQTFWPLRLAVIYPHPALVEEHPVRALLVPALASGLLLVLVSALALRLRRTRPWLAIGWPWFLVTLAPVLGMVQVGAQAHADRYTYLPLIGVAWILAEEARVLSHRVRRPVLTALALAALFGCGLAARAQVSTWKTSASLFEHALAVTDRNHLAHSALGYTLLEAGQVARAEEHLCKALAISPLDATSHNTLGRLYLEQGDLERAEQHLERARAIQEDKSVRYNLGRLALERRDLPHAARHFEAALALDPALVSAQVNLGQVLFLLGNKEAARARFEQGLALDPDLAGAWNGLAAIALDEGRASEAEQLLRRAVDLDPAYADAWNNLGVTLEQLGRPEEARDCQERARALYREGRPKAE